MPSGNKRNGATDEHAPLLNGDSDTPGPSTHSTGLSHLTDSSESSGTLVFLFNSKRTPGRDSDNLAIRSLAYTWHVTKVTILSSRFHHYQLLPAAQVLALRLTIP
jgi:Ca2+:H+ antiporter